MSIIEKTIQRVVLFIRKRIYKYKKMDILRRSEEEEDEEVSER